MKPMLFIDPGDVHVGMAVFTFEDNVWTCTNTHEVTPELGEEMLEKAIESETYSVIGYERFKLFGHLAMKQVGSEFRASQFIGVLKYLHRRNPGDTRLVVQDPNIQPVTEAVAVKREWKLRSVASKTGGHTKSAELHGLFFMLRNDMPVSYPTGRIEE